MLMPASTAFLSIAAISSAANVVLSGRGQVLLQLGDAAGADQGGGHPGVAQGPRDRHLRQRLPALGRDLVQRPDVRQGLRR